MAQERNLKEAALRRRFVAAMKAEQQFIPGTAIPTVPTELRGRPAERLMLATEQINPLIERAERAIESLGFHVTASVLLDEDETSDRARYLRFGKDRGAWILTVDTGSLNDDLSWSSAALGTTSRETRLKALSLLPALVDALSGRAEQEADAAVKIVTDAEDFIALLERTPQ